MQLLVGEKERERRKKREISNCDFEVLSIHAIHPWKAK